MKTNAYPLANQVKLPERFKEMVVDMIKIHSYKGIYWKHILKLIHNFMDHSFEFNLTFLFRTFDLTVNNFDQSV